MHNPFDFSNEILNYAQLAESDCAGEFASCEKIARICSERVLSAFIRHRVSDAALHGSTGYGYGDIGRDIIDKVFADALGMPDALVRHNFVSGTHAISTALFGVLRTNDLLVSVTGKPYDTLEEVIGIRGSGNGSLRDYGIAYRQLDLKENGAVDYENIKEAVKGARAVYFQRSRGYSLRPAVCVKEIEKASAIVREANPDAKIIVDNCYGEFVEEREPICADLIIGSLIKNPGGGIAETGGYIAGDSELVEQCANRLSCAGMGREVGCTLGQNRNILLGLFLAPETVCSAVKTAIFAQKLFERMGFETFPKKGEVRSDIITAVTLGNAELLTAFCRGIQAGSPVDSFAAPEAWDMPGYDSKVIMAAGAFTMGASIELSADAPLREPYAVWLQGGLTYSTGRLGVLRAAAEVMKAKNAQDFRASL